MKYKKYDSERKTGETTSEYVCRLQREISEIRQEGRAIAAKAVKELRTKKKVD